MTRWTNLSPDGFTLYYQHAAGLAGLAWVVAGLAVLRRLLRQSFSDRITAATLVVILLGTNLYHYATFDSGYSHAYSFFLCAALMLLTARWHHTPTARTSTLLGLVAGLIVLVRHTNIVFLALFLLYGAGSRAGLTAILQRFRERVEAPRTHCGGRVCRDRAAAPHLLPGDWAAGDQRLRQSRVQLDVAGDRPGAIRRAQGIVLLVSLVAGRRRRPGAPCWVREPCSPLRRAWFDGDCGECICDRQLVGLAVRRQLRPSRIRRRAAAVRPRPGCGVRACGPRRARPRRHRADRDPAAVLVGFPDGSGTWYGIIPFNDTTWDQYRRIFLQWR